MKTINWKEEYKNEQPVKNGQISTEETCKNFIQSKKLECPNYNNEFNCNNCSYVGCFTL